MRTPNQSNRNVGADLRRAIKKCGENRDVSLLYGTVVGMNPIEVLLDGTTDPLQAADLRVSVSLTNQTVKAKFGGVESDLVIEQGLKRGERVAVLSDTAHDRMYVIERVADGE